MQSWPASQCIFCAFRFTYRSSAERAAKRAFTSGYAYQRNRAAERLARERKDRRNENRSSNSKSRENGLRKEVSSQGRTLPQTRKYLTQPSDVKRELKSLLPNLRATLRRSNASEDIRWADYTSLDPEGVHWKAFETNILALFDAQKEARIDLSNGLEKKFYDAFLKGEVLELKKALQFAFIDHVIEQRASDQSGGIRKYADLRYPTEWYPYARAVQRDIHLHVGPTNSGKTYNALKRLEEAGDGFYAGPLRLLAHEVYSRFRSKGVPCHLVTGDDVRLDEAEDVKLCSSTVEMVDTKREVEVAVIDEIQMMAEENRGWAWTRAFLGANAKEVHLCGETRVISLIRELAASMGDTLHIHHYDRLNPLKCMGKGLHKNLQNLRKGDCIVSFSVLGIHALKNQIEIDTGRRVAIVYGSLPPETRAQQAALFNDPDNDYDFLVASDAIGMGLNLAIKRIIFETIWKNDGTRVVRLTTPQIKQIAGRAGRYRTAHQVNKEAEEKPYNSDAQILSEGRAAEYRATAAVGLVTCLEDADLSWIQEALNTEAEPIKAAGILPPGDFVDEFAASLPKGLPFEYILQRLNDVAVWHPRYTLCNIRDQIRIAGTLDTVKGLDTIQRYTFTASPADVKSDQMKRIVQALGRCVAQARSVTVADVQEIPLEVLDQPSSDKRAYLFGLEQLHKALILFLWLSYRFPVVFTDRPMATHAKALVEEKINETLLKFSANPEIRKRTLTSSQKRPGDASSKLTAVQDADEPVHEELVDEPVLAVDWTKRENGIQREGELRSLEENSAIPKAAGLGG